MNKKINLNNYGAEVLEVAAMKIAAYDLFKKQGVCGLLGKYEEKIQDVITGYCLSSKEIKQAEGLALEKNGEQLKEYAPDYMAENKENGK